MQERGGLRGDAQIGGGQAHGFERGGDERGFADVFAGQPAEQVHHGRVAGQGQEVHVADPGLFQQPGEHCGNLLGDGLLQRVRAVAVFFPFRFVADAADDVRAVGRLGVVFAACRDHAPACRVHEQGGDGGGADVHDKGVCLIRGRIADEGFPMHEAEAAHVAVPVAAPAVGAGVAYEGGQGGELAEAEGVALCAAGVDEALQVAALVVEGRLGHGEGAALHDGPERVVRLREPGEHAQGPGLRKGDVEPLSGAGVTGEAQPGSEGCVAEQGAFLGAGFGGGEDEAFAALADAAGQGE